MAGIVKGPDDDVAGATEVHRLHRQQGWALRDEDRARLAEERGVITLRQKNVRTILDCTGRVIVPRLRRRDRYQPGGSPAPLLPGIIDADRLGGRPDGQSAIGSVADIDTEIFHLEIILHAIA